MKNKNGKKDTGNEKNMSDVVYVKELLYRLKQSTDEQSPFMPVIDDLLADEYSAAESKLLELNNEPDKAVYSFLTGALMFLNGHPEQSREHFKTAERLAPDNDIFKSAANNIEREKSSGIDPSDCCTSGGCECCCDAITCI